MAATGEARVLYPPLTPRCSTAIKSSAGAHASLHRRPSPASRRMPPSAAPAAINLPGRAGLPLPAAGRAGLLRDVTTSLSSPTTPSSSASRSRAYSHVAAAPGTTRTAPAPTTAARILLSWAVVTASRPRPTVAGRRRPPPPVHGRRPARRPCIPKPWTPPQLLSAPASLSRAKRRRIRPVARHCLRRLPLQPPVAPRRVSCVPPTESVEAALDPVVGTPDPVAAAPDLHLQAGDSPAPPPSSRSSSFSRKRRSVAGA